MKISTVFASKWLRAADLQGRDFSLTITRCVQEDLKGDGNLLPVLYFDGAQKGLVLNKTNAGTISDLYGEETDTWAGKKITLFPTQTDFGGKRVDCVRVRKVPSTPAVAPESAPVAAPESSPPAAVPESSPPADDEIPF